MHRLFAAYIWKHELQQGKKYYTTVQACNRANLCSVTSSTSLIFDNSPPTSGAVTVGFDGHHNKFLGHRYVKEDQHEMWVFERLFKQVENINASTK